jgi:hypothetical protein
MTDNTLIAAILAAGMLPPVAAPATTAEGGIDKRDQHHVALAVLHAVGLYRSVLEGLTLPAKMPNRAEHFAPRLVANRPEPIAQTANHERLRPRPPAVPAIESDLD